MSEIKQTSTNFSNKSALSDECTEIYASSINDGHW